MPVRYNYSTSRTDISCSHCGASVSVEGNVSADARTVDGMAVRDFIRWLPARNVWHSWCRSCERAARGAAQRTSETTTTRATGERNAVRRFGLELELIFPAGMSPSTIKSALNERVLDRWQVKEDGSLRRGNGWEITSPPLVGEEGMEQVRLACAVLEDLGAKPNISCGLHVHHEVRDLDGAAFKRLIRNWASSQDMIDGLVSPSRRHAANHYYCKRLSTAELARIERCRTLADIRHLSIARYRAINVCSYGVFGTIEIRQHQGTCDFEKIRTWVGFGQALIDKSKNGQQAMPAPSTIRELVTRLGEMLDETCATFLFGRAAQFNAVPI